MAAYVDDLWELAASYVDLFPPKRLRLFRDRANPLTDLDEVEFHALFRAMKQCFATSVGVGTRGDSRQLRQLQLYRHEMQHFVRVLHEYIANEVVTVSWHEFEADLSRHLAGLDDLCQQHLNYLHKCRFRCLLDQKAVPVMKIVRSIFNLILTFSSQLSSQNWQHDAETGQLCHPSFTELQRTYSTFHEHSLFLFKVVDQLATRGYQPHFDELLLRLNFSEFYKSSQQQQLLHR